MGRLAPHVAEILGFGDGIAADRKREAALVRASERRTATKREAQAKRREGRDRENKARRERRAGR
jgi:hypothetical protein